MQLKVDVNRMAFERLRTASDLLIITGGDLRGPVLTRVAQVHRKQEKEIFATEGAAGGSGPWPRLSPPYAKRKREAMRGARASKRKAKKESKTVKGKLKSLFGFGPKTTSGPTSMKILVWSGETRDRFVTPSNPNNIEEFVQTSSTTGAFRLGARSKIAGYHFRGNARLPKRDMETKTRAQLQAIQQAIVDWYQKERLPQAMRALRRFGGRLTGGPISGGAAGRAANPTP